MIDCIFCKIIKGEIPAEKIYEDDKVFAFLDLKPVSRGHALIIPKVHAADIVEASDEIAADVINQTKRIAPIIQKIVNAEGFTISSNRGEAAGQSVFHLHFHIIPRYRKDGLKPWPHHETESKTRAQLAEEIKKYL